MHYIKSLLLFATVASAATASWEKRDDELPEACGADPYPDELRSMVPTFEADEAQGSEMSAEAAGAPCGVYIHIVSATKSTLIPDDAIQRQFGTLKEEFSKHGWDMKLAGTSKTVNSNWANNKDQLGMKKKLRKGSYRDLNVYVVDNIDKGTTGLCYYPTASHPKESTNFFQDGCTILKSTVPLTNDEKVKKGKGKTLIHEVGHWLGLKHTFEGGCSGAGDGISDTPAQKDAYWECKDRDSCPGGGSDPIHNYMGYCMGTCRTQFTNGQVKRMKSVWKTIRTK